MGFLLPDEGAVAGLPDGHGRDAEGLAHARAEATDRTADASHLHDGRQRHRAAAVEPAAFLHAHTVLVLERVLDHAMHGITDLAALAAIGLDVRTGPREVVIGRPGADDVAEFPHGERAEGGIELPLTIPREEGPHPCHGIDRRIVSHRLHGLRPRECGGERHAQAETFAGSLDARHHGVQHLERPGPAAGDLAAARESVECFRSGQHPRQSRGPGGIEGCGA